jgi:hypothetical protein
MIPTTPSAFWLNTTSFGKLGLEPIALGVKARTKLDLSQLFFGEMCYREAVGHRYQLNVRIQEPRLGSSHAECHDVTAQICSLLLKLFVLSLQIRRWCHHDSEGSMDLCAILVFDVCSLPVFDLLECNFHIALVFVLNGFRPRR